MNQPITPGVGGTSQEAAIAPIGKVAAVTLSFWVIKIIVTTVGDVSGDFLSTTLGLGYVVSLFVALALILSLLIAQLKAARFHPLLYWILILATSTLGAELSDTMDRGLHLGYIFGAVVLVLCLVATLVIWLVHLGRIEIYPISSRQQELYYWLAAIFANSLGSVLGDLVGEQYGLGILGGIAVNAVVMAFLLILHYRTRVNKALLFWVGFVFTRA